MFVVIFVIAIKRQAPLLLDCCNEMLWTASDKLQVDILASLSKDNFYKHIKGIKFEFKKNKCHDPNLGFMTKAKA
jgi:hypothetical protein